MPIRFPCPKCHAPLKISRKYAGRKGKCPSCGRKLTVPDIPPDIPDVGSEIATASERLSAEPASEGSAKSTAEAPIATLLATGTSDDGVHVPRWIVFAQGGLLGTVALSFFLIGWMVGAFANPAPSPTPVATSVGEVLGSVFYIDQRQRIPDMGAVVIAVPADSVIEHRPDPRLLRPQTYPPFDNAAKELIQRAGGQVVRVDAEGSFRVNLKTNRTYHLLIISNQSPRSPTREIEKAMRAELGGFFFPLEDLLSDRDFWWSTLELTGPQQRLELVLFDR